MGNAFRKQYVHITYTPIPNVTVLTAVVNSNDSHQQVLSVVRLHVDCVDYVWYVKRYG